LSDIRTNRGNNKIERAPNRRGFAGEEGFHTFGEGQKERGFWMERRGRR